MKYRSTMCLFSAVTVMCTLLRTIQLAFTIDIETGFIKKHYSVISIAMMAIIFLGVAMCGIFAAAMKVTPNRNESKNVAFAAVSIATGCMFIFDSVISFGQIGGKWYDFVLRLLGLLVGFIFAVKGVNEFVKIKLPNLLYIVPVIYFVLKLVSVFITTSSLALTSENVYIIVTNSALLLFIFEYAKLKNGITEGDYSKKIFAFGIISAMLCFIWGLPKIILCVLGTIKYDLVDISSSISCILLGMFVICFIASDCKEPSKSEKASRSHLAQ